MDTEPLSGATPIFPGWRGSSERSSCVLPPDSHVLEQMLCALHQDDAVKWGVLAHHAAGAISAHDELQQERER